MRRRDLSMADQYELRASKALRPEFYYAPYPEQTDRSVPFEFQFAGVEYAIRRDHCLFGDAPGVGKTLECIMLGNAIEAKRTLVVCPASLRLNWEREIWRWSTTPNVTTYPVLKSSDGISHAHNYVIISYSLLWNPDIFRAIMDVFWDHLILDEAHALKDPQGNKRTKAICGWNSIDGYVSGVCDVAGRITMASGTILPNQPREAYNAIRLLDHSAIDYASLDSFVDMYYDEGYGMIRGWVENPETGAMEYKLHHSSKIKNLPKNMRDLQYRMRKSIMVRRTKDTVLPQLPPVIWHPFPLENSAKINRVLKHDGWRTAEKLYKLDESAFDDGIPVDGAISTMRRELGEAKVEGVAKYIVDLMESGVEKIVVAAWHHSVLHYLFHRLKKYGLAYMDGSTSAARRQQAVDDFQTDDGTRIILGQTLPLCEGWTFTAAAHVVNAEPDWVPGKNNQLVDRIARIGQTASQLTAHLPIVPGTLDERIVGRAIWKDKHIFEAMDADLGV